MAVGIFGIMASRPEEKSLLLVPEQAPALFLSPHWLFAFGKGQIIPLS